MMRLKSKLLSLNADKAQPAKVYSPANCEELRIPFRKDKIAKVVGKLAQQIQPPKASDPSQLVSGVLVQNDFKLSLMAPEDLREYAGLTTTTITCKQHITLRAAGVDLIRWALESTFGTVKTLSTNDTAINGKTERNGEGNGVTVKAEEADEEIDRSIVAFIVMDCVIVRCASGGEIEIEWEGNMVNDGIADAVLAVLFTVESSPAAVKRMIYTHLLLLSLASVYLDFLLTLNI